MNRVATIFLSLAFAIAGCSGERAKAGAGASGADAGEPAASGMTLCAHRLIELDSEIAAADLGDDEKAALQASRETAQAMCAGGQEAMAVQMIDAASQAIDRMDGVPKASKPAAATEPQTMAPEGYALGEPRDDLERFYGLYALPDNPDRQLFVARATSNNPDRPIPDGYIMIGAMWGDAANWYMKSVSDTEFEQEWVNPGATPLKATFTIGDEGEATAMSVRSEFMNYEDMPRTGDLPADWR